MRKSIIIISLILCANSVKAQFSVMQDGKGETSFQLFRINTITINTEKTSLGFSITPKDITNTKGEEYWTVTVSANAKESISNLFKGGEFQFSGKLGANLVFDRTDYGGRGNPGSGNLKYHFVGVELLYSRNNVFDSMKDFDNQIFDKTNIGFRVNYGWNFQNVRFKNRLLSYLEDFTAGISGSIGIKDNTDIISQVEIITSTQSFENGTSIRTVSETENVYELTSLIPNQKFSRFNLDFGKHFLNKRIFANLHMTYAIDENLKPVLNPSFGFFAIKKGAPLEAVVGIQIQTSDWSNNRQSENDRWERTNIVLTAGFPF
ncbi:hypothetical protein Q4Q35_09385 [Flavivirga aquimarina]|uniref:DUF2219 domain-containing protein n=1 Tax=Flavivirga aquimarina TaxID=2027862 RepID=A0ABT8WA99_9FLAO|nr:hypothetical protein [Flavivirga aquimarina]MDO5970021.1 hypothetical protein [Flavivirga aquimarina]